jgi:type I pantothenate kinase
MAPAKDALASLAGLLGARARTGEVLVVGLTGSVAAGKSTLCEALKARMAAAHRLEVVATDGFLLPNAVLAERGLSLRKGFPESYDIQAMTAAIAAARAGPTAVPGYSHVTYDVEPALTRIIDRPDILLLDGLGLAPHPDRQGPPIGLDLLVYLDADEADVETWFVGRFMGLWRAAQTDPASFYAQFRGMTEPEADRFARMVWTGINLPNLRDHVIRARDVADIVIRKAADHSLTLLRS